MMGWLMSVVVWWLPTAGAIAGLPLLSTGVRAGAAVAALLWFTLLRLTYHHTGWIQNPWAARATTAWPETADIVQALSSGLLVFAGLRLIPAIASLAVYSLGATQDDSTEADDGASTPETSLVTIHFVLLMTLSVLTERSRGLTALILPEPAWGADTLPPLQATAIAGWLIERLQHSVSQALEVVAPFLIGGVLAELLVLTIRGALKEGGRQDRWRPVWVLGILMLMAWSGLRSEGMTEAPTRASSTTLQPREAP
jgi:hypothetical protein